MRKLVGLLGMLAAVSIILLASRSEQTFAAPSGMRLPFVGRVYFYTYSGHNPAHARDLTPRSPNAWNGNVVAVAAGTVLFAGDRDVSAYCPPSIPLNGLQKEVRIEHSIGGQRYTTVYAHLSSTSVSVGQAVGAGQSLGQFGNTGCATETHLHFEVHQGGAWGSAFNTGTNINVDDLPGVSQVGNGVGTGDATGPPVSPLDTDGDGIPDTADQCDTQPEDFDGYEDSDGCPEANPAPPILAVLRTDGGVYAKQGGLTADWVFERGEAKAIAVDGSRLVVLGTDGGVTAKDGLFGEWVFLGGEAQSIAAAGNRVAVVRDDGGVQVKEGTYGEWTYIVGDARQVTLAGNRIAVVLKNDIVMAKDGIFGEWVGLTGGARSVGLDGDRIAVLQNDGALIAKDSMQGEWVGLAGGFKDFAIGGNRIAGLQHNNQLIIKTGTYGEWTFESGEVCNVAVANNWLLTVREDHGVVAKDFGVGEWIYEIGETSQVAATFDGNSNASTPDGDCDGAPDVSDNCAVDSNPGQQDFDLDAIGDACDADDDGDSCPDAQEQQTAGGSELIGGRRDPRNPNDYFNPSHDGLNRVDDIVMVLSQYFVDQNNPAYTSTTDRTLIGPNAWNLGPPNGLQRIDDIVNILKQYFHDCG